MLEDVSSRMFTPRGSLSYRTRPLCFPPYGYLRHWYGGNVPPVQRAPEDLLLLVELMMEAEAYGPARLVQSAKAGTRL